LFESLTKEWYGTAPSRARRPRRKSVVAPSTEQVEK
jgi:hypothetical protein